MSKPYSESFRTFAEGKRFLYSVSQYGRFIRTLKSTYKEEDVVVYLNKYRACVKINGKTYTAKHIVAEQFCPEYQKGMAVVCVDGNALNISLNNLRLFTRQELGKATGHKSTSKPIMFDGKRYRSVREAAKNEYVSYQTIHNYINGRYKRNVLEGHKVRYIKENHKKGDKEQE